MKNVKAAALATWDLFLLALPYASALFAIWLIFYLMMTDLGKIIFEIFVVVAVVLGVIGFIYLVISEWIERFKERLGR